MPNPLVQKIESLLSSPFEKEKADLVICRVPDSSGVDVNVRHGQIIAEHQYQDYRLIPAELLDEINLALRQADKTYLEQLRLLADFMRQTPREYWPETLRRSEEALE